MNSEFILSLGHDQLWFSASCINHFSDYPYIQIYLNENTAKLIIRPCKTLSMSAIPWMNKDHKTKMLTCHYLYAQLCSIINYESVETLKIIGNIVSEDGEEYLVFSLPVNNEHLKETPIQADTKNSANPIIIILSIEVLNDNYFFFKRTNTFTGGKTACHITNYRKAI